MLHLTLALHDQPPRLPTNKNQYLDTYHPDLKTRPLPLASCFPSLSLGLCQLQCLVIYFPILQFFRSYSFYLLCTTTDPILQSLAFSFFSKHLHSLCLFLLMHAALYSFSVCVYVIILAIFWIWHLFRFIFLSRLYSGFYLIYLSKLVTSILSNLMLNPVHGDSPTVLACTICPVLQTTDVSSRVSVVKKK